MIRAPHSGSPISAFAETEGYSRAVGEGEPEARTTGEPDARRPWRSKAGVPPLFPGRGWFNRWFSALADHIRVVGDNARLDVRESIESGLAGTIASTEVLAEHVRSLEARLLIEAEAMTEAVLSVERGLARIDGLVVAVEELRAHGLARDLRLRDIDQPTADALNRAHGALGPLDEAGVYFNLGLHLDFTDGGAVVGGVNERILEVPFVHRVLSDLPSGSRVLDVGATESTLAVEFASRGYRTTAIDPRPYPLRHPNLDVVVAEIQDWDGPSEPFDAVIAVSAIEHFGLGHYVSASRCDLDAIALQRISTWMGGDAPLVLTVPVGRSSVSTFQRVYDASHLDELLASWKVLHREVYARVDHLTWTRLADDALEQGWPSEEPGVALMVCTPQRSSS